MNDFAENYSIKPGVINPYLESVSSKPISESKKVVDIVSRPDVHLSDICKNVPRGTLSRFSIDEILPLIEEGKSIEKSEIDYFKSEVMDAAEVSIKYKGYIDREQLLADKIARLENLKIPEGFDFSNLNGLTIECRQKLAKYNPRTIAQASRISGVSPSDISVLLVYLGR